MFNYLIIEVVVRVSTDDMEVTVRVSLTLRQAKWERVMIGLSFLDPLGYNIAPKS
jgi:hypothetical protein